MTTPARPTIKLPKGLPAGVYALGEPLAEYASVGAGCVLMGAATCVFLLGLFFVGAGYMVITDPQTPKSDHWLGWLCMWAIGAPIALLGVWMKRRFDRLGSMKMWVMSSGLAWSESAGAGFARWEDVTAIYVARIVRVSEGRVVGESMRITVATRDGSRVLLSEFIPGIEELTKTLESETGRLLGPALRARVDAGEAVMFDQIRLDSTGVHSGSKSAPWGEIERIGAAGGTFSVQCRGQSSPAIEVDVAKIPNYRLFAWLIESRTSPAP